MNGRHTKTGAPSDLQSRLLEEIALREQAEGEARQLGQELREKAKQLEAAELELAAFTHSISHDLRAPLRSIKGYSDLLIKERGDEQGGDSDQYLAAIVRGAERLNRLLNSLMLFSRAGRSPLNVTTIDPAAQAKGALHDLGFALEGQNLDIQIDPMPSVSADSKLLRQAFSVLLSNAMKFSSPERQTRITVGSLPRIDDQVTFYVRDNGVGFDQKYACQLFHPFVRLHGLGYHDGSALGLATLDKIVCRHGGRCWAEGDEGRGATIYFTIPVP